MADAYPLYVPPMFSVDSGVDLSTTQEDVLRAMKVARESTGIPLDFWADLTEGLPYNFAAILCGRSAIFPKYMNSSVSS